ncbi:monooxygenase [Streptomyces sp. V2]|uniref:FAD-dependent monooxygenase n=1 Tax=Streptomyces sp. V2 TaxID=1424099 RepID=UPI000D669E3D|nr:FAD-dependent monooxygenase [Streptomyces sp. V2]PWG14212.1 monooxygenase [Streptomyces sp. V2]
MHGGRVAVVGGSIAGNAAAIALRRAGAEEITVYERASGRMAERGVGVAVHNDRYAELEAAGYIDAAVPWGRIAHNRFYVRDGAADPRGRQVAAMPFPFRTYNWGSLWQDLSRRMPAGTDVRTGTPVEAVEVTPQGAVVHAGGRSERYDAVVGADGYRSAVRSALYADVRPEYAGYLAWRGAYPDSRLRDPELLPDGDGAYILFDGGHLVVYRIPDGTGGHRVNWVLYSTPPPGLDQGMETPTSVPPGTAGDGLRAHLAHVCAELLPPYWADLVQETAPGELLLQPIYDFTAPHYAVDRALLVGDAATVARPHTGAGAVKALQDITLLETSLTSAGTWSEGFAAYDAGRAPVGRGMVGLGRQLGQALVTETPNWRTFDQTALETYWKEATGAGGFGGRGMGR